MSGDSRNPEATGVVVYLSDYPRRASTLLSAIVAAYEGNRFEAYAIPRVGNKSYEEIDQISTAGTPLQLAAEELAARKMLPSRTLGGVRRGLALTPTELFALVAPQNGIVSSRMMARRFRALAAKTGAWPTRLPTQP